MSVRSLSALAYTLGAASPADDALGRLAGALHDRQWIGILAAVEPTRVRGTKVTERLGVG